MVDVKIYTWKVCPYCAMAKKVFERLGVDYEEISVEDEDKLQSLVERTGQMTVPQIFIGEAFIGGYDDLHTLEVEGKLKEMLDE